MVNMLFFHDFSPIFPVSPVMIRSFLGIMLALLGAYPLQSAQYMTWDAGMTKRNELGVPAMVYLGSEKSVFFEKALNNNAQELIRTNKIVLIQASLIDANVTYPLNGQSMLGWHLGVLLSGAPYDVAGRIIFMDKYGVLMPTLRFSRYVHDCNPTIVEDLMHYVIEEREDQEISLLDYSKIRKTQLVWEGFMKRLNDRTMNFLVQTLPASDWVFRYADTDGVIRPMSMFKEILVLSSMTYCSIEKSIIEDLKTYYGGKAKIVVILPKEYIPQVAQDFKDYKNLRLYEFIGPRMIEYPKVFFQHEGHIVAAKGYMPAEFYRGLFPEDDQHLVTIKSLNLDMPIGEYRQSN